MKTVYVGMSGGVDSSVTAALLQRQGFRVVGVYMKNWTADVAGYECPWRTDLTDARAVAATLDIQFKVFDFQNEYREKVAMAMVCEYGAGRTPNPDVMCNQEVKFKLFLDAAVADGADFIATGHYAKTSAGMLTTARDVAKDQTYFLYRVTSDALRQVIFPLGDLTKPQVRALAAEFNLPTATKPDSQGICFVGEVGIKAFLSQYVTPDRGPIVLHRTGQEIGCHSGAIFYTIGQRQGLGIGGGKPYYVTRKNMSTNTVYVTDDPTDLELSGTSFKLSDIHWIGAAPMLPKRLQVRTRYRGNLVPAKLSSIASAIGIELETPVRALSPGQSAVIYDGETVLGGGIIEL